MVCTSYDGDPSCGDHTGRGALDMIQVVQDNIGIGGTLILANWNSDNAFDVTCIATSPPALRATPAATAPTG